MDTAIASQPIKNPQCTLCTETTQALASFATRRELVQEFPLDAEPCDLLQLELICHGRRDVTPVVRAVIALGPARSNVRRACTIREPEIWRRAYQTLRGCALRLEDVHAAERILPKLVIGGFLVLVNARGDVAGHVALPIAHIVQHFARCG